MIYTAKPPRYTRYAQALSEELRSDSTKLQFGFVNIVKGHTVKILQAVGFIFLSWFVYMGTL